MAYYSRGDSAVLNLNMRETEENLIYKSYLPMVFSALAIQLGMAGIILGINRSVLKFMEWKDDDNRTFFEDRAGDYGVTWEPLPEEPGFSQEVQWMLPRD
jgi:hypothetical protein